MWTLIAVAVLAIGGIVFALTRNSTPPPAAKAAVPDVVGFAQADAEAEIRSAGLVPSVKQEASTDVATGQVISTDPVKDTKVDPSSTVVLTVSSGPAAIELTDMSNWSQTQAEDWLKSHGFNGYSFKQEPSADVPVDKVTRTDPARASPSTPRPPRWSSTTRAVRSTCPTSGTARPRSRTPRPSSRPCS